MTIPKTIVLLRADGNSKIGLGHVHRLLALSEMLKEYFECRFIIHSPLPGIRDLILKCCESIDEPDVLPSDELARFVTGREIVVLDGYHFDAAYQQNIKRRGSPLICIDDLHQQNFVADVIINPAGGVTDDLYSKANTTKLFSGPKFSLLKNVFLKAAKQKNKSSTNSLLICMGGADPENHTLATLKHCLKFPFASFYIVVGEAYPYKNTLHEEAKYANREINILSNIEAHELVSTMNKCNVAASSASGIAYEYLSVGGELYVKQTAPNQKDLYSYLINNNLAFPFEDFRVHEDQANKSFQIQREVFDGDSGKRILKIFHRLDFESNSNIRRATTSDLMTIFHWANDPELRAQSFSSDPITLEKHSAWFNVKVNDPSTVLYIFEYKNIPIGQVRFDIRDETIINYSIEKAFRGRGWGQPILEKAIAAFLKEKGLTINKIIGYVKQENVSSNMIFNNLGFVQCFTDEYPNTYRYDLIVNGK